MGRQVKLVASQPPDFEKMTELEILKWNRAQLLIGMTALSKTIAEGDVYPQVMREMASLSGKVKQLSSEIRMREKASKDAAGNLSPRETAEAAIQLISELPKELRAEVAAEAAQMAAEGGLGR